jgi:hypothetical protein
MINGNLCIWTQVVRIWLSRPLEVDILLEQVFHIVKEMHTNRGRGVRVMGFNQPGLIVMHNFF